MLYTVYQWSVSVWFLIDSVHTIAFYMKAINKALFFKPRLLFGHCLVVTVFHFSLCTATSSISSKFETALAFIWRLLARYFSLCNVKLYIELAPDTVAWWKIETCPHIGPIHCCFCNVETHYLFWVNLRK